MLNRPDTPCPKATRYVVLRDEPGYPCDPDAQRLTLVCDRWDEDGNPVDGAWLNGETAVNEKGWTLARWTSRDALKAAVLRMGDKYGFGSLAGVITVIEVEVQVPLPVETIPRHDQIRLADIFTDRESDPKYL